MEMAKECLKKDTAFGINLINSGREVGEPAIPEAIGCTASIVDWDMQQLGVLSIRVRGEERYRILSAWTTDSGLTRGRVELMPERGDSKLGEEYSVCARLLETAIEKRENPLDGDRPRFESTSWVSLRLAELLPLPLASKQRLLETPDAAHRIAAIKRILEQNGLTR